MGGKVESKKNIKLLVGLMYFQNLSKTIPWKKKYLFETDSGKCTCHEDVHYKNDFL